MPFGSAEFIPPNQTAHSPSPPPYIRPYGNSSSAGTEPPRIAPPHIRTHTLPSAPSPLSPGTASDAGPVAVQRMEEDCIKIEDLFPLPPSAPWGLAKVPGGFDWTATPMLAMQNITTSRAQTGDEGPERQLRAQLVRILRPEDITRLVHIFDTRYAPWLNLPPKASGASILVTLAQCTVASRHLDPATRAAAVGPLQKLAEDAVFRHFFLAVPTTQAIHALMILALWSPIGGPAHGEARDGRLLVASAVSLAMNLRLSQAIEYVAALKEDIKGASKSEAGALAADLADGVEKARLWLALMNVEWLLCVGTGRPPLSRRTTLDFAAIDWSSTASVSAGRDMRIALVGQLVEVTEAGLRTHCASKEDFGKFHMEVKGITIKFDNLLRLIYPLPVVTEREVFYFHMLLIYHHVCRLLVMHHCMRETRRVFTGPAGPPWFAAAEHGGVNLATQWGQEAILLAEGALAATLARPGDLQSAPDSTFALLCFAASFLVMCKIAILHNHGMDLPGSSNALLARAVALWAHTACAPDHAPAKCAQLVSGLIASFEQRALAAAAGRSRATPAEDVDMPVGGAGDIGGLLSSEVMLDTDFWSSFMDNLATDVPYMEGVRAG
ncbi:hypothetical protein HWV62_37412 [Athelia sp. TMB]|nr:hypothetical protein HWV62_37412 [Athelia sp. TMB]